MKKKYINPEIKVIKIDTCSLMQGSGKVGTTDVKMSWEETANNGEEGLARENSFFWEPESLEE
jgi:hypothetical protein